LSLAILLSAQRQGLRLAYYKPIQCGTFNYGTPPTPHGDADWIRAFAGHAITFHVTYKLQMSASPHLAAERENKSIDLGRIESDLASLVQSHDLVLMEGVGGAAVPLNRSGASLTSLAGLLALPTLLACAPGLGTLHHSLTTIAFLKSFSVPLTGFVFCHQDIGIPETAADNRATLQAMTGVPCLGELEFCPELNLGPEALKAKPVIWPSPLSIAWEALWKQNSP
jgi:dethiobiotin synthetase